MRLTLVFIGMSVAFLIPFLIWGDQFEAFFQQEAAAAWFDQFGAWAWFVALLVLAADLFLPIPATAVMATLGFIYGPVIGGTISFAGSVLSGLLAYGLCRTVGEPAAKRILGAEEYRRSRAWFGRTGGWVIALSRWMPLLPEVISCAAGLTRMPFDRFLLALVCGSAPLGFTYAIIGAAGGDNPRLAMLLSAFLPPALWVALQPILARLRKRDD